MSSETNETDGTGKTPEARGTVNTDERTADGRKPFERLLEAMGMREREGEDSTPLLHIGNDIVRTFHGKSIYFPTGRVYGGQIVAQSLLAAGRTVPYSRLPHSIHAYFVTPGDIRHGICYDVDIMRDGRSFSARDVSARQGERTLLTAIASYQTPNQEGGPVFSDPQPENVPDPEGLPSSFEMMRPFASRMAMADYYANKSSWDIRNIPPQLFFPPRKAAAQTGAPKPSAAASNTSGSSASSPRCVWMRANVEGVPEAKTEAVRDNQLLQRALLATGCDQLMMSPALLRAHLSYLTPGIRFATIDHSMWWYRNIDVTRWHLYALDSPIAGHGRALCRARVFQDGVLVAEITQEALIRVPEKD